MFQLTRSLLVWCPFSFSDSSTFAIPQFKAMLWYIIMNQQLIIHTPSLLLLQEMCRISWLKLVSRKYLGFRSPMIVYVMYYIWVRSRNCGCLVTWFCYQLIAKPGNKTATVPWPDPYTLLVCKLSRWISKSHQINSNLEFRRILKQYSKYQYTYHHCHILILKQQKLVMKGNFKCFFFKKNISIQISKHPDEERALFLA